MLRLLRPTYGADFTIDDMIRCALDADAGCRRVIADVAAILGRCIAGACNIVNPEAVVLAGDLVHRFCETNHVRGIHFSRHGL